ncbi:ATP-dependent DEAD/DEAH box helicase family protein [Desulforapulum autotrophicum HRM2]|uniref:ATP-dependent DEAD/DEAH box helicase family protein n=1 Tax=Desulforapulum autotrophicum (strain ATCC 43914 / DSM 3382 / VKM B-1955 / HRM2) TaxID=177437 RepID=C0QJG3_DESAH|nr:DEAD/DEAH box helicase [Desulforapulum autotrophicum]ACN15976.1 ATP-dependent DEAD/DEAH box helicase family protein [Desulforapulum autotrophicum HRM2]
MTIAQYLNALKGFKGLAPDLVCHRTIDAKKARYGDPLDTDPVWQVFQDQGIQRLYEHQARGVALIEKGVHTVIATPTASGKSLVYNLPVLRAIYGDNASCGLYLFPLKALARDQLGTLETLMAGVNAKIADTLTAAVYDGDLSAYHKAKVRNNPPNVLLTNPEMLHLAMLPHHHLWESFFANLKFVVVDEVHTYRGVMGSHMAWVFRRLLRICRHYGAEPVFVFCSATISNPGELSTALTGLAVEVVDADSAPAGKKDVLLMNGASGAAQTAILLMHAAIHRGLRTIVYTQSRKITELIAMWASQRAGDLGSRISAYRAGFLPEERQKIEQRLASGELLAVVTTSALELGIDIGNLDLCILVGYPGTIMSTWQRAGRVGRDGSDAAMILVAHEDALDHFFVNHPAMLFDLPPEQAVINPFNPVIMERHLECAAADLRLDRDERFLDDPAIQIALGRLEADVRLLKSRDGRFWYSARQNPHREVNLRGTGMSIPIFLDGQKKKLGDVDRFRAFYETHWGAVYLHHGSTYLVSEFDHENGRVQVVKERVPYFTRARSTKSTEILSVIHTRQVWQTRVCFGRLRVTDQVTGFEKRSVNNQRSLGVFPLELPPIVFETEGVWIEIPEQVRDCIETRRLHFMGGIHALEHAAIGILPLLVMTDRNDLGGISIPFHPQVGMAAVFVYDGTPGGIGLARQAFEQAEIMLERTFDAIRLCKCDNGCPACVHSPKCGSGNRPIDKGAALEILLALRNEKTTPPVDRFRIYAMGNQQPEPSLPHGSPSLADKLNDLANASPHGLPKPPSRVVKRFGVLDIETRRSAQEVGGWGRAHLMGVSCAVLFDSGINDFRVYLEADVETLVQDLQAFDLVIGFNIKGFDYKVLSGLVSFDLTTIPTLDMLVKVHERLGYRLSLDALARCTLGTSKSADGLAALEWWKQGEIHRIIEYCKQDVKVTRDLYLFGREHGFLVFENKAKKEVCLPVAW